MPCFCSDLALRSVPKPGLGMEARAGARGTCAASPECTGRPHSGLGEGARGKGRAARGQASSWGSKQPHPGLSNTPRAPCSTQGLSPGQNHLQLLSHLTSPFSCPWPGWAVVSLCGFPGCRAQCSWLPAAPQSLCQQGLLAELAPPDSVGKHGGIAPSAVPPALGTNTKPSHCSGVPCCASCDPVSSQEGEGTPFEAQSSSSPAQGSLGHCNAAGQVGTAQGSLLLFFVQLPCQPPSLWAFCPSHCPSNSQSSQPASSSTAGWWDRAGLRNVVSREEVTTGDTGASLPGTAPAAELQVLLFNSFHDAH